MANEKARHDWSFEEIEEIYNLPFPEIIYRTQTVHRANHEIETIQGCHLPAVRRSHLPYCRISRITMHPNAARYNNRAAELAWRRTVDFWKKHLSSSKKTEKT